MQLDPIKISIKAEASHSTGDRCECELYSQAAPPTGISVKLIKHTAVILWQILIFFPLKILSRKFMETLPCDFRIGSSLVFFALARKTAQDGEKHCGHLLGVLSTRNLCLSIYSLIPFRKDMTSPSLMKLPEQVMITFSFLYFELTGPY